ncbi:hypothetical protein [Flavobacterium sp.]|uniref:hypothetical protein n=1 Tax=Flavobacterium sp. TaxID=239 RepID=UPI0040343247
MKPYLKIVTLLSLTIASIASVGFAFKFSEDIIHYDNKFIRRYPPHVADEFKRVELTYNSYYFAGASEGTIYLGNITAPLQIIAFDTNLNNRRTYHVELVEKDLPFRSPQVRVLGNYFYVYEGSVPYLFKGKTADWVASLQVRGGQYFSQVQPLDSVRLAIRYIAQNGESIIGLLNLKDTAHVHLSTRVLQKQIDGIFDTDGSLHVSQQKSQIVYNYRYRNQYIISDPEFRSIARGNTIDTVSKAQIVLAKVESHDYTTFSKPPLIVNKTSALYNNYLFVNSLLPGQFEPESLWKNASIVDIYDVSDQTYRSSFPIYHIEGKKLKELFVMGNKVYALIDTKLVGHMLQDDFRQQKN